MIDRVFEPFPVEAQELLGDLEQSPWGEALRFQERYGRYMALPQGVRFQDLDPATRAEVLEFWEGLFDTDVNNLAHNPHTALLGMTAGRIDGESEAVINKAVKILSIHDAKEARLFADDEGDITYDLAVARGIEHHRQEHVGIGEMLKSDYFPGVGDEEAGGMVALLDDSKKSKPETPEGQLIEIAERTGYLRTALIAREVAGYIFTMGRKVPKIIDPDLQYQKLLWMAENPINNHLRRYIEIGASRPSAAFFLDENRDRIAGALHSFRQPGFLDICIELYSQEPGVDIAKKLEDFWETQTVWHQYADVA